MILILLLLIHGLSYCIQNEEEADHSTFHSWNDFNSKIDELLTNCETKEQCLNVFRKFYFLQLFREKTKVARTRPKTKLNYFLNVIG